MQRQTGQKKLWKAGAASVKTHISPLFFIKFVFGQIFLRLATREGSLAFSLLTKIDPAKVAMDEIKEAFCRDIDNLDFKSQVPFHMCN